jgi:hypothetical protein
VRFVVPDHRAAHTFKSFSGLEPILPLFVALIFAELCHLSVVRSPNVHFRK